MASAMVQSLLHHPTLLSLSLLTYRPIFVPPDFHTKGYLQESPGRRKKDNAKVYIISYLLLESSSSTIFRELGEEDDDIGCCAGDRRQKKRQTAAKVYVGGNCGRPRDKYNFKLENEEEED